MAEPKFFIDGQEVDAPRNWNALEVLATFDKSSPQANISTTEIQFVNQSAVDLINYILNGADGSSNGIFVAKPITIEVTEPNTTNPITIVFDGLIDTVESKIIRSNEIEVKIKDLRGLETLESLSEGLTFGLLYDKGEITNSDFVDIPYVVQKEFDPLAVALLSISLYSLFSDAIDRARQLVELPVNTAAHTAGGVTGPAAGAIYTAAVVVLRVANLVLLVIQIKKLMDNLLEYVAPVVRHFKGMKVNTMLEKGLNFLGYDFDSSITELNNLYFLPSKEAEGEKFPLLNPTSEETGLPRIEDNGYIFVNFLEAVMKMFGAKLNIDSDDVVHLEPLNNDGYWINQSTYQKPDVLNEGYRFNTEDAVLKRIVSFQTDLNDTWTRSRYTGTAYEVTTEPLNITDKRYNLIKGIDDIRIPYALGTRKDDFTVVEEFLLDVANQVDAMIAAFNGTSNFSSKITQKIGMLRISENFVNVPKMLYLNNATKKIPSNHRDLLSARALYNNYINHKSFVANEFGGQYRVYEGVRIPFALSDFIKLSQNSYFFDSDGSKGQVTKLSWRVGDDYAEVDYRVQEAYTTNLTETFIEP